MRCSSLILSVNCLSRKSVAHVSQIRLFTSKAHQTQENVAGKRHPIKPSKWRGPSRESIEHRNIFSKGFQKTKFDTIMTKADKFDINDAQFRLPNAHYRNIDRLHYTYRFACSITSVLLFVPVLWLLYSNHSICETVQACIAPYFTTGNTVINWVSEQTSWIASAIAGSIFLKVCTHLIVMFAWLCMTDGMRYRLFVNYIGPFWQKHNWLFVTPKSAVLQKYIWLTDIMRGKRGDRHVGLL